jgi:prepilin-type N-terminal cleavage/methylation domain-containing protein
VNTSAREAGSLGNAGFTLLEMVVAVAILSLVLLMAFGTMKRTTEVSSMESLRNQMERSGAESLEAMVEELNASSVLAIASDGSLLTFQVPVDLDGNGTVLDADGNCEFGLDDLGVVSNGSATLMFVQNQVGGNPEVLSEAALGRDLNGDGDRVDIYDRGRIVRNSTASALNRTLTGVRVIQPSGNWGGDIDGDGQADPVFRMNGKQVWIDLWTLGLDEAGTPHLIRCQTSLHLRN